ncbi:two-component sensor histidine kinase [Iamia sp. SCSIO 61187]|uniref:sensor histidine kinase n=1 Tax=Iamia sp. SCSIO 61187 TaxID=2722752 RepID=UPI001C633540|nr:histidine kinase [Iamia sp. SCSIO 61187]QYG94877.1 two-component sensor histidine kinase [Iamia sp. SCSIO 61187]
MLPATSPAAPGGARAWWDRVTRLLPWVVDLAVVGAVGVVALIDVVQLSGALAAEKALAGLAAVALAGARRWAALPALALLVAGTVGLAVLATSVVGDPGIPALAPIVAVAALSTPVVRRQPALVAAGAAAAGAVAVASVATWPSEPPVRIVATGLLGGAYALGVGAGVYLRHLDGERLRAADAARRSERIDIARELHDLVAHYITGIVVQAQAAQVVADRDPAAAGAALERIEGAGRDALTAMRGMVGTLRGTADRAPTAPPAGLAALDDLAGLEDLVARSRRTGLPVTLGISAEAGETARGATAAATHRIVQEALTNVHRHAVDPTRVDVAVRVVDGHLVVTVADDGRLPLGPDPTAALAGGGFGLIGMAERAEALGGRLVAGPAVPPEQGWRVEAVLPAMASVGR